ncbi:MAG: hypothetical protein E7352_05700 [Clostridiales bacterium]|nr:hypothetical protein [Clostridiales bacterium]MBE5747645.1 hypothetical protein [Clostridiales bacterium]
MSKEKKFHQLIEDLDQEEKKAAWEKIKESETVYEPQSVFFPAPKKKRIAVWKKALATGALSVLIVGVGAFVGVKYFLKDDQPTTRYYDASMYETQKTSITLRQRAEQENKKLLFLDWYDVTDFYMDQIYTLNDSNQIIGYYEQIVDINTGSLVEINIVNKAYQLQSLENYDKTTEISIINSVQVDWKSTKTNSRAKFSYGDYNYYVMLEYPMEDDSILDLIEEMLS